MKIAIYAICKNEIGNIAQFLESAKEADCIRIVDTGSTDGTLDFFPLAASKYPGLDFQIVQAEFQPFAFDTARNMALNWVEQTDCDFALFVDLDERIETGWADSLRALLELHADKHYNVIGTYMSLLHEGRVCTRYVQNKGHALGLGVSWKYSAHEVFFIPVVFETNHIQTNINFTHHKDESKERKYLDLLKQDFESYPNDHRCIFYYGRELYYAGQYEQAVNVLETATKNSYGYFMSQHLELLICLYNSTRNAKYLYEAVSLNQLVPEIYYLLAVHHYKNNNFNAGVGYIELLLNSVEADKDSNYGVMFKDPDVSGWKAFDIMSVCYWNLGELQKAVFCGAKALELNPTNQRLIDNIMKLKQESEKENQSADNTESST